MKLVSATLSFSFSLSLSLSLLSRRSLLEIDQGRHINFFLGAKKNLYFSMPPDD
jgi:hypothetical protein